MEGVEGIRPRLATSSDMGEPIELRLRFSPKCGMPGGNHRVADFTPVDIDTAKAHLFAVHAVAMHHRPRSMQHHLQPLLRRDGGASIAVLATPARNLWHIDRPAGGHKADSGPRACPEGVAVLNRRHTQGQGFDHGRLLITIARFRQCGGGTGAGVRAWAERISRVLTLGFRHAIANRIRHPLIRWDYLLAGRPPSASAPFPSGWRVSPIVPGGGSAWCGKRLSMENLEPEPDPKFPILPHNQTGGLACELPARRELSVCGPVFDASFFLIICCPGIFWISPAWIEGAPQGARRACDNHRCFPAG